MSAAKDAASEPRLYELGAYMAADVTLSSGALGAYVIELDPGALETGAGAPELLLPTPVGDVLRARRTSADDEGGGDFVWRGRFGEEDAEGRVILTYLNHRMSALILGADRTYEIVPSGAASHLLLEIDPALFPECKEPLEPTLGPEVKERVSPPGTSALVVPMKGVVTIDVMTLYTPQARDAAGGVANIEALILGAVNVANTAFEDSGSVARFHLVHTALAAHSDAGDMSDDLSWLKNDTAVGSLRDLYQADLVSLIVNDGAGSCGVGYVMRNVGPSFAPWAFQVTARSCASANLSYAHEHGHNLGLEHDPANGPDPADASYPWSFGHFVDGSFRTVMSYSSECSSYCPRVTHFSNPGITYNGDATGIANARDNRRTLDEGDSGIGTAMVAAAFRGDDPYEENDTLGTAYDLSSSERTWLSDLAGLGIQADDDWYKVGVTPGFERVVVDLRFSHSEGDIDVMLYDAGGVPLAGSYSVSDNEYVDYTVPSSGTYYIQVFYANARNSYNLYWDDLPPGPWYPDLVVPSITVSDTTLHVGEVVTIGATVRNQGSGPSETTTLRYYGSLDPTIGTDDIELGTDAVGALSPGGSSSPSESFETPDFLGTYWVGACVDATSELVTGNNCSSGVQVTIAESAPPSGHALSFDGVDDRVEIGAIPTFSSHTLEAWIRPNPHDGFGFVAGPSTGPTLGCTTGVGLRMADNKACYFLEPVGCANDYSICDEELDEFGVWMHVAGTWDGTSMRFYVNGQLVGVRTGVSFTASSWMTIGAMGALQGYEAFFSGEIDEVRVWSYARTVEQIRQNQYSRLAGNEAGLVGYWRLDEGVGQTAFDASSASHDGMLGVGTWGDSCDPLWVGSGMPSGLIFADGFESRTTAAWANAIP